MVVWWCWGGVLTNSHFGSQTPDLSTTPKRAQNLGIANPSFRAGNKGLGRPNEQGLAGLLIAPGNGGQQGPNHTPHHTPPAPDRHNTLIRCELSCLSCLVHSHMLVPAVTFSPQAPRSTDPLGTVSRSAPDRKSLL